MDTNDLIVARTRAEYGVDELRAENERLRAALDKSVKLQSHYAGLLNQYDGGTRLQFANSKAWIDRLATIRENK